MIHPSKITSAAYCEDNFENLFFQNPKSSAINNSNKWLNKKLKIFANIFVERIKIYLDTNLIIDFFINQAIAMRKNIKPKVPNKIKFFFEILDRAEFITSFFTEAEVARELVSAFDVRSEEFDELWQDFLIKLNCKHIEEFTLNREIANLAKSIKLKLRTIVNFIHIFIAIKEESYVVSGDKDLIKIVRENKIYSKIFSYPELRDIFSSTSSHL